MTVISKQLFYEKVGPGVTCREIIHPWTDNCLGALPFFLVIFVKGVAQFFLPIYSVKIVTDKDEKNVQYLKKICIEYLRSILYGTVFASFIVCGNCLLTKIPGRFLYYNVAFVTGVLSGGSIFIETIGNQKLDSLMFFNLVVESLFSNIEFFKFAKLTKAKETGMFMIVSSILMYLFKNNKTKISPMIWFYTPTNKAKFNQGEKCNHDKGNQNLECWTYWFYGFRKYFAVGYAINIIRTLIPTFGRIFKKPLFLINIILKKSNVKFGLFVGGYVALFRMISCALYQFRGRKEAFYDPAISGLLSGITYGIEPRINVLAIAISSMFQVLYFKSEFLTKMNDILPLRCFLLMISNGILLHNRIFCLESCPKYYTNLTNIASHNWAPVLYKNLVEEYILKQRNCK